MMGTFLNLVGAVRTLLFSIALVAVAVSVLSVFNTLLAAVVERTNELCVMRAVGASRSQIAGLIATEALLLACAGSVAGIALAAGIGSGVEHLVKQLLPLAPAERLLSLTPENLLQCAGIGTAAGALACLYPAWRASRLKPAEALKAA